MSIEQTDARLRPFACTSIIQNGSNCRGNWKNDAGQHKLHDHRNSGSTRIGMPQNLAPAGPQTVCMGKEEYLIIHAKKRFLGEYLFESVCVPELGIDKLLILVGQSVSSRMSTQPRVFEARRR